MKWTERTIASALAQQFFNNKYLVVVPNCNWTWYEADILAVTENLRLIDIEIKISRSDLKADAKKNKWWTYGKVGKPRVVDEFNKNGSLKNRRYIHAQQFELQAWPRKIWKHYYALPAEIWSDDLLPCLGSKNSGVLLLTDTDQGLQIHCERRAKPNRSVDKIPPGDAVNIARLASLRMWNTYRELESLRSQGVTV